MNIPGLTDENVEIFAREYPHCDATCNGKRIGFFELPEVALSILRKAAFSDKEAMKTFKEEGITDENIIVETWTWCNLGRFDVIPDIETRTGKVNIEFHNCGKRGKCPNEFRRCKRVKTDTDELTPRETIYAMLAAKGLDEKNIAQKMNIKEKSTISLAQRVRGKVGVDNRAGLASWVTRVMF